MSIQNVLRELPRDAADRKAHPIATGVLDYFPLALAAVAALSKAGNDQHNPGQPLHWARGKSSDHADCIVRHLIQRGTDDVDGVRHTAKVAWRALALLQEELEAAAGWKPVPEQETQPVEPAGLETALLNDGCVEVTPTEQMRRLLERMQGIGATVTQSAK